MCIYIYLIDQNGMKRKEDEEGRGRARIGKIHDDDVLEQMKHLSADSFGPQR